MGQLCPGCVHQQESHSAQEGLESQSRNTSFTSRTTAPPSVNTSKPPKESRNNNYQPMGNSAVKQHFETAKKTGVLKLSQGKLTEFPPNLKQLEDILRTLDLSENRFTEIPNDIGSFSLLKHLNLNHNRLTFLPQVIGDLVKLESLSASNNKLTNIPESFAKLTHLKQVNLSNNQLTAFPLMFNGIVHLDVLDLSKNRITAVPDDVSDLRVTELILNQNRIASISEKIADCPRLKTLRLEENCLQLPAIHRRILVDSKISILVLDGNLFDMKSFADVDGYDEYMERYTAMKKKMF